MRISDWSSDVCSSDLDELREVVKKARSGSSEALAKAELKLSRTFARYVSDVSRKPSIKITYLDRELEPERLTEAAVLRAAALVPSFADYMDDAGWMSPIYMRLRDASGKSSEERRVGNECVSTW